MAVEPALAVAEWFGLMVEGGRETPIQCPASCGTVMSWMAITRSLFGLDPVVCPESAEDGRVAEATPPPIHKLGRGQEPQDPL